MSADGTPSPQLFPTGGIVERHAPVGDERTMWTPADFYFDRWEDDFKGDSLDVKYPNAKTNGTSAAVTFTEHNLHGFLDFITGTDNAGYAGQGIGLQWSGDRGLLFEFLFTTPSSLADFKLEVGIADADDAAGMVNSKSGVTGTGTDYAVLIYDTADDSNTQLIHAKDGTDAAVSNTDFVLAVSTTYYVTLSAEDDNVRATIQGVAGTPTAQFEFANATADAGIQGGTPVTPWFFTQARAGSASKTTPLLTWGAQEPRW